MNDEYKFDKDKDEFRERMNEVLKLDEKRKILNKFFVNKMNYDKSIKTIMPRILKSLDDLYLFFMFTRYYDEKKWKEMFYFGNENNIDISKFYYNQDGVDNNNPFGESTNNDNDDNLSEKKENNLSKETEERAKKRISNIRNDLKPGPISKPPVTNNKRPVTNNKRLVRKNQLPKGPPPLVPPPPPPEKNKKKND